MRTVLKFILAITAMATLCFSTGHADAAGRKEAGPVRVIITSDTILSGMVASLLPPGRYAVEALLPPGQCPGHYDVKLSDVEKTKKADLIVAFRGMTFMDRASAGRGTRLLVDTEGRNWMAPDSYIRGVGLIADGLAKRFPAERDEIMRRKRETIRAVRAGAKALSEKLRRAGVSGRAVIASSMQKEPLAWMGFRVVGEYGRPEAMSAREFVHLVQIGRERNALLVADNLQSGPDTGKGIAETMRAPHVVLTNFPSEKGYLVTLGENVDSVLAAVRQPKK
jgi:zinc transport system substrate-binding protein